MLVVVVIIEKLAGSIPGITFFEPCFILCGAPHEASYSPQTASTLNLVFAEEWLVHVAIAQTVGSSPDMVTAPGPTWRVLWCLGFRFLGFRV